MAVMEYIDQPGPCLRVRRWITVSLYDAVQLKLPVSFLPCALATNYQTFLIGRFLQGLSGSASSTIVCSPIHYGVDSSNLIPGRR